MLTKKQRDLLLFIHERMKDGDIAPSFEEMKNALNLKSKSGIHRLITGLVERGYLERLPHRARALEIKRLPEGYKEDNQKPANSGDVSLGAGSFSIDVIPMHGKIAAGTPIEAIEHSDNTLQLPTGFIGRGEHYGLTIEGDSMINAGIYDGDTVIIEKCNTARDGEIIVALIDGHEATLKTLKRKNNMVTLQPENDDHHPQTLEPNRVQIQGRLTSLLRTYH